MRLDDIDPSGNINDQGEGGGGFSMGGGGGLGSLLIGFLPLLLGRKMGCGTILLLAVGAYFIFGSGMLNLGGSGVGQGGQTEQQSAGTKACDTESELFACRVFTSTESTWSGIFPASGRAIPPRKTRILPRRRSIRLWCGPIGDGAILLPGGSGRLSRHRLFPAIAANERRR